MILGITERYELTNSGLERYFIGKKFKDIFEKLNILLFPICSLTDLSRVIDMCDGLLVIGSPIDIDARLYNEEPIEEVHKMCKEIDTLDFALIKAFNKMNKPILGICRGIQAINVYFGGSLYQDINGHKLELEERHNIKIEKDSFLYNCYNKENIKVNSIHHQSLKKIAPEFKVTAVSEDGIIEAIEKDNIIGVQWHPEMMEDMDFFKSFVKMCEK